MSAYDRLWDLIEANSAQLSSEVWSWNYNDGYQATPLGTFVPTESNIRQLWSLTFLAIKREAFNTSGNGTGGNGTHDGPPQFEGAASQNSVSALLVAMALVMFLAL